MQDYGRFALLIDGPNFYHTIRDLRLHVDYKRLLEFFRANGTLVSATYYTTLLDDDHTPDWLIRLTDWLAYNGYRVVTKPARLFRRRYLDEEGVERWVSDVKGDVDVEITVDLLTSAAWCDTVFLFSGDGEFVRAIEAAQQRGCRVIVVSSEKTGDSSVSNELRRQADWFLDIASIADDIRMPDRPDRD